MEKYLLSIVFCIFSAVLLFLGGCLVAESRSFEKNKVVGKAEIIGYDNSHGCQWFPIVRICGIESKASYNCKMKNFIPSEYPKGTILDVEYRKISFLGSDFYDIQICDDEHKTVDPKIIGNVVLMISFFMLLFALIAFIIKFKSM